MDIIFQYAEQMIDLSDAILEHRHGLNDEQGRYMETIHKWSLDFITNLFEYQNTPLPQFRHFLNHDALTPLTVTIGYADILLMNALGELKDPYREAIQTIRDYSAGLMEEVRDLQQQLRDFMDSIGMPLELELEAEVA